MDRQEFLTWLLEQVEKSKYPDEPTMRIMMPIILQYGKEFVQVIQFLPEHLKLILKSSAEFSIHCVRNLISS